MDNNIQMKRGAILFAALLTSAHLVWAQTAATDTLVRAHDIDEVVVTGTREATDVRHLSQTVSVVNRGKIERDRKSVV